MRAWMAIFLLGAIPLALHADLEPSGVESSHLWSEVSWRGMLHEKAPDGMDGIVIFRYVGVLPDREGLDHFYIDADAEGFFAIKNQSWEAYSLIRHEENGDRCILRAAGQIGDFLKIDGIKVPLVKMNSPSTRVVCRLKSP
jgi:hypothetical protein